MKARFSVSLRPALVLVQGQHQHQYNDKDKDQYQYQGQHQHQHQDKDQDQDQSQPLASALGSGQESESEQVLFKPALNISQLHDNVFVLQSPLSFFFFFLPSPLSFSFSSCLPSPPSEIPFQVILKEEMKPSSLPRSLCICRNLGRESGSISSSKVPWKGISEEDPDPFLQGWRNGQTPLRHL